MKKKKSSGSFRMSMRVFFFLFVMIELLIIDVVAMTLVIVLGDVLPFMDKISGPVWMMIVSGVMGGAITAFLAKFLFDPMMKLRSAMRRVAQGDFQVEMDTRHMFPEIRQINRDFNLMAKELSSTEILKTEFVSNVSHEFKTPINAIEGYATLLQGTEITDAEEQSVYIDKILFNTRRLSKLVGNILLLSKVDNQGIQTHQTTFRLDEQIRQSILALEPNWTKHENEFDVDLEEITYTGNENLLLHVWNNLLDNAIKYGPQGGLLTLRLTSLDNMLTFTIDDEGPGISEEAAQHIFDRFYQQDTSRKTEGNGLGLALVKQIVTLADGTISVENLPEKGCRFTVRLPL